MSSLAENKNLTIIDVALLWRFDVSNSLYSTYATLLSSFESRGNRTWENSPWKTITYIPKSKPYIYIYWEATESLCSLSCLSPDQDRTEGGNHFIVLFFFGKQTKYELTTRICALAPEVQMLLGRMYLANRICAYWAKV